MPGPRAAGVRAGRCRRRGRADPAARGARRVRRRARRVEPADRGRLDVQADHRARGRASVPARARGARSSPPTATRRAARRTTASRSTRCSATARRRRSPTRRARPTCTTTSRARSTGTRPRSACSGSACRTRPFTVKGERVTLADIAASDLSSWPASSPLQIADATGPIIEGHNVALDGLRRTPLWSRVEALLGRPLCTLGDRGRCEAAAERADVCAARSLPIASPGRDLRYLVALGPDQIDLYGDDRPSQARVPIREYFQLLRGSGVHAVGSLVQLTDAFGRVIYDPTPGAPRLAASWFPAPAVGVMPAWSCTKAGGHANTVLGADGGLCAVVQTAGTAHAQLGDLLADPKLVVYGAKTGTIDSLADIARRDGVVPRMERAPPPVDPAGVRQGAARRQPVRDRVRRRDPARHRPDHARRPAPARRQGRRGARDAGLHARDRGLPALLTAALGRVGPERDLVPRGAVIARAHP